MRDKILAKIEELKKKYDEGMSCFAGAWEIYGSELAGPSSETKQAEKDIKLLQEYLDSHHDPNLVGLLDSISIQEAVVENCKTNLKSEIEWLDKLNRIKKMVG